MTFNPPSEDTVDKSWRAIRKYDTDKKTRERRRLELAREGLVMVAPGQW